MESEFDTVAGWTADAVLELGHDYAIPAGCRGSGNPSALEWLAEHVGVGPGTVFLDAGAGVGGPAAFLVDRFTAAPVLAEPMLDACVAARRLFGLPTVAACGAALPFAATFPAAWLLGVLCTTSDKGAILRELRRVLTPDGRLGLVVYVRATSDLPQPPSENDFPSRNELLTLLGAAQLTVVAMRELTEFGPPPATWDDRARHVDELVRRRHAHDPRWMKAHEQEQQIRDLLEGGLIHGVVVATRRA
jgi:SAM-dependent methyltransferase